jgi:hypothetical protein
MKKGLLLALLRQDKPVWAVPAEVRGRKKMVVFGTRCLCWCDVADTEIRKFPFVFSFIPNCLLLSRDLKI